MCLASIGLAEHVIVRRGVEFLLASVRTDGSWPIDTNLATWNTTLAINALDAEDARADQDQELECLDWLLDCQHVKTHPFTDVPPGGWAWTDLTGGVPDVDDTSGALLALITARKSAPESRRQRIGHAARTGMYWLLDMQNRDGGWPTFCRGWGKLPFDRSASDLTAHALRAIHRWREVWQTDSTDPRLDRRVVAATERGVAFLGRQQLEDGSWLPLWFGNQNNADDVNPVYGTARVLKALVEIGRGDLPMVRRGADWLACHQHASGGWGAVASDADADDDTPRFTSPACSVEETSVAVSALIPLVETDPEVGAAVAAGLTWLVESVESGRFRECSPVGFYFAKLWYYERLYPLVFSAEALGIALSSAASEPVRDELRPVYSAQVAARATPVGE
jgi:squalene-hopene/tetraprenyl-beta-curcumene cyclase